MIASPHVAASLAGHAVLARGGTAVDAAIAANAVLCVVYPASCGLGGDLFALVYEPRDRSLRAYNGSGRAPLGLNASALRERGMHAVPTRGPLSVSVPGAVRAWEDLARAHGRFGLDTLLDAAHGHAADGFVITDVVATLAARNAELLAAPEAAGLFFSGRPVRSGEVVRSPALAETIQAIRDGGAEAFYAGPTAERIVRTLQALGSPMTLADLGAHRTEEMTPLRLEWHGYEACAHPPNSQAVLAPMVLAMLRDDGAAGALDWTHTAIEAFKHGFDVRDSRFGEPSTMAPIDDVLDPAVLARARAAIDPLRARDRTVAAPGGGTIAVVAVDGEGRAISLIESIFMNFGSGIVAEDTGVFLHNRGAYFTLEAGHPNELRGGHRPLHTLSPGMLLRDGRPELVYGTMGGDGQPQTQVQIMHNYLEGGLSLQSAIDAPRFVYGRDSESSYADSVRVESRMDPGVVEGLRERGHHIEVVEPYEHALGHAHAIAIDYAAGTLAGASDPRADSAALPL
jgi:gamma-glutamyltranspeptidase/glutathione hydrolase